MFQSGRWITSGPTTALILALPFYDDPAVADELMRRASPGESYVVPAGQDGLWEWQRWLLARVAPAAAERDRLGIQTRRTALCIVANLDLDPKPAVETMLRWLDSGNQRMIQQGVLELKCVLHRLGPNLDRCLTAIQAHAATPDQPTRWDVEISAVFGDQARGRGSWSGRHLPALGLDPSQIVEKLRGKSRGDLLDVYEPLGLSVQFFTRPFEAEPGPFRVDEYDPDLDGDGRRDRVVRIGDHEGYYWNFLVFLRLEDSWTLVDCLRTAAGPASPPEPRSITVGAAGSFLVVRTPAGRGDGYLLQSDAWFQVDRQGCHPVLSAWADGHTDALWRGMTGIPVEGASQLTTQVRALVTGRRDCVEYEVGALFSDRPRLPDDAALQTPQGTEGRPIPPTGSGEGRIALSGTVRYVWTPSKRRFILEPAGSTWTPDAVVGVCTDGPVEMIEHHAAHLAAAAPTLDARARTWLGKVISFCGDTPAGRTLEAAISATESTAPAVKPPNR